MRNISDLIVEPYDQQAPYRFSRIMSLWEMLGLDTLCAKVNSRKPGIIPITKISKGQSTTRVKVVKKDT